MQIYVIWKIWETWNQGDMKLRRIGRDRLNFMPYFVRKQKSALISGRLNFMSPCFHVALISCFKVFHISNYLTTARIKLAWNWVQFQNKSNIRIPCGLLQNLNDGYLHKPTFCSYFKSRLLWCYCKCHTIWGRMSSVVTLKRHFFETLSKCF